MSMYSVFQLVPKQIGSTKFVYSSHYIETAVASTQTPSPPLRLYHKFVLKEKQG